MKFGSDAPEERLSGGLGDLREPDDEVKEAVAAVKEELETKTGKQYKSLDVIKHRVQVVAGLNFFAKVRKIFLMQLPLQSRSISSKILIFYPH